MSECVWVAAVKLNRVIAGLQQIVVCMVSCTNFDVQDDAARQAAVLCGQYGVHVLFATDPVQAQPLRHGYAIEKAFRKVGRPLSLLHLNPSHLQQTRAYLVHATPKSTLHRQPSNLAAGEAASSPAPLVKGSVTRAAGWRGLTVGTFHVKVSAKGKRHWAAMHLPWPVGRLANFHDGMVAVWFGHKSNRTARGKLQRANHRQMRKYRPKQPKKR